MDAAKDLLKRAVELDSAGKYSESLICYEEGIQNILRAIGGKTHLMSPGGANISSSRIKIGNREDRIKKES